MAKEKTTAENFVNPFSAGVSYEAFLAAIPEEKSIREYLTGKELVEGPATEDQINWIETEIEFFKSK